MRARRLAALVLALLVAGASVSPCTAEALAQGSGACHEAERAIAAQCQCGCSGDGPRAAASPFSAPWALPAPTLARVPEGDAPAPPGRPELPTTPAPSRIDHVPISS